MSISSLGGLVTSTPSVSTLQQARQDYLQLEQALANGNLSSAQGAFSDLQQALQASSGTAPATAAATTTPVAATPGTGSTLQNDVAALGSALTGNNLSAAQAALQKLQADLQSAQAGGHHHHHHGGGFASLINALTANTGTGAAATGATTGTQVNATA